MPTAQGERAKHYQMGRCVSRYEVLCLIKVCELFAFFSLIVTLTNTNIVGKRPGYQRYPGVGYDLFSSKSVVLAVALAHNGTGCIRVDPITR